MSGPVISLGEFESSETALDRRAYEWLRDRHAGRIDVAPTERPGFYRLAAREYVGRIGLPGGALLVVRPRAPITNLFYMLASDASAVRFFPPPTGLAPDADIFSFLVTLLLDRVEHLATSGLYRAYVERESDLPLVRGRILVGKQVARRADLKHRHECAFADLTADVAENRVLLAALLLVPSLLHGGGAYEHALVRRARSLALRLGGAGVSPLERAGALALLPWLHLHRLNASYGPAIGLSKLVLRHLSLDEREGSHPFASFLVDMPLLFESFVTARLRHFLRAYGLRVAAQRPDFLDVDRRIGIRPDVLVFGPGGGAPETPLLVLDAKYRRMGPPGKEAGGPLAGLNADLYQLGAYMERYRLAAGALVYPRFGHEAPTELQLEGTGKRLHLFALDLGASGTGEIESACMEMAARVAALCAHHAVAPRAAARMTGVKR